MSKRQGSPVSEEAPETETATAPAPGKTHRDALNRVIRRVQLDAVRLRFTHVEFNVLDLEDAAWAEKAHLVFQSHLADHSDTEFSAHVQYLIRYFADDELDRAEELPAYDAEEPPAVELTAHYEVQYRLEDSEAVSEDDLEHFCSMNPIHNTWSFWREYVYNMTGRMGVQPVLVPLLPIPAPPPFD